MLQCSQSQEGNSSREITKKKSQFLHVRLCRKLHQNEAQITSKLLFWSNLTLHIPACVILSDLYAIEYIPIKLP